MWDVKDIIIAMRFLFYYLDKDIFGGHTGKRAHTIKDTFKNLMCLKKIFNLFKQRVIQRLLVANHFISSTNAKIGSLVL